MGAAAEAGNGTTNPGAYPPPQPPYQGARPQTTASAWGCAGCILVILLAILVIRWFYTHDKPVSLAALAPADTLLYIEANTPSDCRAWLDCLAWPKEEREAAAAALANTMASALAEHLPDTSSREARLWLNAVERAAMAWAPGDGDRPAWLLLVRWQDKAAMPPFIDAAAAAASQTKKIVLKDGQALHLAQIARITALSTDSGLVRFAQDAERHPERTLTRFAAQAKCEPAMPWALVSPKALTSLWMRTDEKQRLSAEINRCLEAKGYWSLVAKASAEGETLLAVSWLPADISPGTSTMGWLLRAAGWVIAVPLAIVALLAATAILLAIYHYVLSWWHGRLSPRFPPHVPDLPAAVSEDLATSSVVSRCQTSESESAAGNDTAN